MATHANRGSPCIRQHEHSYPKGITYIQNIPHGERSQATPDAVHAAASVPSSTTPTTPTLWSGPHPRKCTPFRFEGRKVLPGVRLLFSSPSLVAQRYCRHSIFMLPGNVYHHPDVIYPASHSIKNVGNSLWGQICFFLRSKHNGKFLIAQAWPEKKRHMLQTTVRRPTTNRLRRANPRPLPIHGRLLV